MSGAHAETTKKKITTQAETTPVRSRLKRCHINWPGERPSGCFAPLATAFSAVAASSGSKTAADPESSALIGLVIVFVPRGVGELSAAQIPAGSVVWGNFRQDRQRASRAQDIGISLPSIF